MSEPSPSSKVINQFMGVFFGFYRSSQIWGNLISTLILQRNETAFSEYKDYNTMANPIKYEHDKISLNASDPCLQTFMRNNPSVDYSPVNVLSSNCSTVLRMTSLARTMTSSRPTPYSFLTSFSNSVIQEANICGARRCDSWDITGMY